MDKEKALPNNLLPKSLTKTEARGGCDNCGKTGVRLHYLTVWSPVTDSSKRKLVCRTCFRKLSGDKK